MKLRPLSQIDLYKTNHLPFYGSEMTMIYENFTPRSVKYLPTVDNVDNKIVLAGLQYFLKWFLCDVWENEFFKKSKIEVIDAYKHRMTGCLGEGKFPVEHIEKLHDLGYLPILIKALPEGSVVKAGIPYFTIRSTHPEFAWVPGFLEDPISNFNWRTSTSATISRRYKQIALKYANETTDNNSYVDFFFHDFSLRGMGGSQDAAMSGFGHLCSFVGSDNVPAMDLAEEYYNIDPRKEMIGVGVVANEHSCVCAGGKENEFDNYKKWITETFPTGIVSLVSDTWSLWNVITHHMVMLKDDIMKRDGKVVLRPDSSPKTPLEIICGDPEALEGSPENKGAIQLLWEIFGGSVNSKGYKELDPHIGLIYGEALSIQIVPKIYQRLKEMGFAANNIVMGIGSAAFIWGVSRDTLGWACKATACEISGKFTEIFKDPVTDSGMKKSAKGLLRVDKINGEFVLKDQCTWEEESGGELVPVYENGKLLIDHSLSEIRNRLKHQ